MTERRADSLRRAKEASGASPEAESVLEARIEKEAEKTIYEIEAEKADGFSREISATVEKIAGAFREAPIAASELGPLPSAPAELQSRLAELEQAFKSLDGQKAAFKKALEAAGSKIDEKGDTGIVREAMDDARQAYLALRKIDADMKAAADAHRDTIAALKKATLKGAGFGSVKEADIARRQAAGDADGLARSLFGLGSLLYHNDIVELRKREDELDKLAHPYHSELHFYGSSHSRFSVLEDAAQKGFRRASEAAKDFVDAWDKKSNENWKDLDKDTIGSFDQAYIDATVRDRLALEVKDRRSGKYSSVEMKKVPSLYFGSRQDREEALRLIAESFKYDMSYSGSISPEDEETKKKLTEKIGALPNRLRDFVQSYMRYGKRPDDRWVEMYHDIARAVPVKSFIRAYSGELQHAGHSIERMDDHMAHSLQGAIIEEQRRVKEWAPLLSAKDFDMKRWEVFRSDPKMREHFGEAAFARFEDEVSAVILSDLKRARDKKRIDHARKLYELGRKDAAPFLILEAFRADMEHGRNPFTIGTDKESADSMLCRYAESFSLEELEEVRIKDPVLAGVLETIRGNKSTFAKTRVTLDEVIEDLNTDVPRPKNTSVLEEIQKDLDIMNVRLLESESPDDRTFAINMLTESREPLGPHIKAIDTILSDGYKDYFTQSETKRMLMSRFESKNDIDAIKLLIKHDDVDTEYIKVSMLRAFSGKWDGYGQGYGNLKDRVSAEDKILFADAMSDTVRSLGHATEGNYERAFEAFIAAENLGIDIKPTSEDVVALFEHNYSLNSIDDATVKVLKMAHGLAFDEAQTRRLVDQIYKKSITNLDPTLWSDKTRVMETLVHELKPGKDFMPEDKAVLEWSLGVHTAPDLIKNSNSVCTAENWPILLTHYIRTEGGIAPFPDEVRKPLLAMFSNDHRENRDFCLTELKKLWREHLDQGKESRLPIRAELIMYAVMDSEGAGDLKYIDGIAGLMGSLEEMKQGNHTVSRTKDEVYAGLKSQEERFERENWSEDDKTAFYNISKDFIEAAPSLYGDFLRAFGAMDARTLKDFSRTYFPLYQANLIVLQGENETYEPRDLVRLRNRLEMLTDALAKVPKGDEAAGAIVLAEEEKNLIAALQGNLERRFGLKKVPEAITAEHIRYMKDCAIYLANMNERNATKDLLVGFYLGLNLAGKWEDFRAGKEIDPSEYFDESKAGLLSEIIDQRKSLAEGAFSDLGLDLEATERFKAAMQEEVISHTIGNIQTIDMKLGNAKRNLEELADPDAYGEAGEKALVALLKENGKAVGATLAKTYAQASGKGAELAPEEAAIQSKLKEAFGIESWSAKDVKRVQGLAQLPNLIIGMVKRLEEDGVEREIAELKALLVPSKEIVDIFNSMGEEFNPTSGAMALSQDLLYLENVIVKNGNKLEPAQKQALDSYLSAIRAKMSTLESLYGNAKEYFDKIRKGAHANTNKLLKERIAEIEKVLYQSDEAMPIVTKVTSNLTSIIENMRQCLGCLRKEVNNDTNLTFGDPGKFYLLSQGDAEKGSIADEIAFFVPVALSDGRKEMSFVMDVVYGSKSSDVLVSHARAMVKKASALNTGFPDAKMSVFVSRSALASAGITRGMLEERVKREQGGGEGLVFEEIDEADVTVPESAFGDNYIEFGGDPRTAGERKVSGLRIGFASKKPVAS